MSYNDLITLYFDRSSALQWYWTLYVVVLGGLLAFSSLRQRPDFRTGILVTLLYCGFAYKNLGAIHDTTLQRIAVLETIKATPAPAGDMTTSVLQSKLMPTIEVPTYESVRNFHVVCDVLTVLALWAMERRRVRYAKLATAV